MTNEMAPKVRLVKCPKCRKLLPEPAGVPIYSCGGCGAILRAKVGPGDAQKKKQQYHVFPDNKDSSNLSHEVASPSPMEHSPNLQKEEDRDLSSSTHTVTIKCSTEEGDEEPDRISSSTKPSSFQEPITDATTSTEKSNEVCSSADLASHEIQELPSNVALYSDANASDGNPLSEVVLSEEDPTISTEKSFEACSSTDIASHENQEMLLAVALCYDTNASIGKPESEVVQLEEPKHDGSGKSLETDCASFPVDSDSSECDKEPDKICHLVEASSSFIKPETDPMISMEKSAEVYPSTDLTCDGNQELSLTTPLNSDANDSSENPEIVAVQSEGDLKHDGSKSSEIDYPSIPVDSDQTTTIDSSTDKKLKTSENFAPAEYLEPTPILRKITGEVSHDEIDHQSAVVLVTASRNISEEATAAVSRESTIEERSILQKQIVCHESFPGYRTMSSKSISTVSDVDNLCEGFGMAGGGHLTRFQARSEIDEFLPHGWGYEYNSIADEGTSNQKMGDPFYRSTSYPCERFENILPQDKEELLRMVMELQNQLKRMCSINEERSSSSNFYSYQQSNPQFDHPSSHYPYGTPSMYSSSPSTIQWDCETKPDDQMYGYPVLKNTRERTHYPKRHFRPMAGACPLITCYNCSELLQIPEDFLLCRRKRCHWLRCGACSVVLRFSLQDKTHITPYQPELDEHDNSLYGKNLEGLRSCDGYGVSICRKGDPTEVRADDYLRYSYGSSGNSELGSESSSRRKGSSALHQLMGYSSVSQLLS
ncbi:hypothetical protein SAY87_027581 [Trapa incisa]|uniref:Zinc-ribbon domain-containing protein n=1 Tax=Trapa incisa TaxID=236973 RepID=A0AAN7JMN3_9MYRT|nr:hypothetical protein SAY87_027581 [Trapa incisa]